MVPSTPTMNRATQATQASPSQAPSSNWQQGVDSEDEDELENLKECRENFESHLGRVKTLETKIKKVSHNKDITEHKFEEVRKERARFDRLQGRIDVAIDQFEAAKTERDRMVSNDRQAILKASNAPSDRINTVTRLQTSDYEVPERLLEEALAVVNVSSFDKSKLNPKVLEAITTPDLENERASARKYLEKFRRLQRELKSAAPKISQEMLNKLEEKYKESNEKLETAKEQVAQLKKAERERKRQESLKQQQDDKTSADLIDARNENAKLREDLEAKASEISAKDARLLILEEESFKYQNQKPVLQNAREEIDRLRRELDAKTDSARNFEHLSSHLEDDLSQANSNVATTRSSLSAMTRERDKLARERDELKKDAVGLEALCNRQEELTAQEKNAKESLERDLKAKDQLLAATNKELATLKEEKKQVDKELVQLREERTNDQQRAKKDLDSANTLYEQLRSEKGRVDLNLEVEKKAKNKAQSDLTEMTALRDQAVLAKESANTQLLKMSGELRDTKKGKADLEKDLGDEKLAKTALESELRETIKQRDSLEENIKALKKEKIDSVKERDDLQQKFTSLEEKKNSSEKALQTQLAKSKKAKEDSDKAFEKQINELKSELANLKAEKEECDRASKAQEQLRQSEIVNLQREKTASDNALNSFKERHARFERSLKDLRGDLESLKIETTTKKSEFETALRTTSEDLKELEKKAEELAALISKNTSGDSELSTLRLRAVAEGEELESLKAQLAKYTPSSNASPRADKSPIPATLRKGLGNSPTTNASSELRDRSSLKRRKSSHLEPVSPESLNASQEWRQTLTRHQVWMSELRPMAQFNWEIARYEINKIFGATDQYLDHLETYKNDPAERSPWYCLYEVVNLGHRGAEEVYGNGRVCNTCCNEETWCVQVRKIDGKLWFRLVRQASLASPGL